MSKDIFFRLILAWEVICLPSFLYAADERVSLMLTGVACPQSHAILEHTLTRVPGVRQIDLHAVPDHVLIDADIAVVDAESLATQVNDILSAQPPCHAMIMKSCISADRRIPRGQEPRETSSIARRSQ